MGYDKWSVGWFNAGGELMEPISVGKTELMHNLNTALENFKVPALCVNTFQHRHFSFADLQLLPGCKISKIEGISRELGLALRSQSSPILKTMPDKGVVRLQMTFKKSEPIYFNNIYTKPPKGVLPFLLGETDEGKPLWVDMAENPHLLVAGATGAGKSYFLHLLIANAMRHNNVQLFLTDTKRVEFERYRHLSSVRYFSEDFDSTVWMLNWLVEQMESRYEMLAKMGYRNIDQCPTLDKILVIMDEVADLMMMGKKNNPFELAICRLAQKARAAGIYLVAATQRPSVDVITGLIKANFPARLACRVSSKVDSSVIFDSAGAENLMGRGDALFRAPVVDATRFQIALPF